MSPSPKVALASEFVSGVSKLPQAVQSRVWKWALKFQQDPTSKGINYENIKSARDPNLKSVRIDQDWRGIVFKPPAGDVYVLLHVDRHDAAYRWAEGRKLSVNPVTGALQLLNLEVVEQAAAQTLPTEVLAQDPAIFEAQTDAELLSLGVPVEMISVVRKVRDEATLDELQPSLPVEAYEGLFLLMSGDTVSQILHARETRVDRTIDTQDFGASLETAESQARFVVVSSDAELTALLNAPLAQWRVFLHPTQRKLATGDRSGPMRVLGGAGTGKTVLAMHRAKWLAEHRATDGRKVLFTTFTRNLATDIHENLKTLCSPDTLKRIEVENLDQWVHRYLRRENYLHQIIYDRDRDAWNRALEERNPELGLPPDFYEQEWEQVVLANGIMDKDAYRAAVRAGRGTILNRQKRDAIWPVFEEYRAQLSKGRKKEVDDAYHDAAALITEKPLTPGYAAIVVDETQDFGSQALRLLRAMIPQGQNDLFFVGDGHQRIYGRNRTALGRCGIDIRGRGRKLYVNYRTTEEIRNRAVAILQGCEVDDLDGALDENKRYKSLSHGPVPETFRCSNMDEAFSEIEKIANRWSAGAAGREHERICIMTREKRTRDAIQQALQRAGHVTSIVEADSRDEPGSSGIRLATMHRAKGLEFDEVVVLVPAGVLGPAGDEQTRKLAYVALTRAKTAATIVTG